MDRPNFNNRYNNNENDFIFNKITWVNVWIKIYRIYYYKKDIQYS